MTFSLFNSLNWRDPVNISVQDLGMEHTKYLVLQFPGLDVDDLNWLYNMEDEGETVWRPEGPAIAEVWITFIQIYVVKLGRT